MRSLMRSRMKACLLFAVAMPAVAMAADGDKPATVQSLGFTYAQPKSTLEITFDKEVTFEKNASEADKQLIIDIPNAKIGKKWSRRIDTSQHKSNVVMVSPYQSENRVRVTLQLKENGGTELSQDGKTLRVLIDNMQAAEASGTDKSATAAAAPDAASSSDPAPPQETAANAEAAPAVATETPPASGSAGESIDQFLKSQDSKQYSGKRIFLQVQDSELSEVFRVISEASEFNILLSDNVKGKVMLNLTDVPWDQALDIILHSYRLAAERQGNVLRITTLAALTAEREAEIAAKKAKDAAEPLVVKIFPISYAKVDDLKTIIVDFLSKDPSALNGAGAFSQPVIPGVPGANNSPTGLRGSIQVDPRTNSLVIRDTASTLEKVKRVIKELDTQTPQILIEGKFVEVKEQMSSSVSGRLFVDTAEFDSASNGFSFKPSNNNFGAAFNTTGPAAFSATSFPGAGGAGFGFMPKAALLPGIGEIGAFISLLSAESSARVISSPRVVTQNKEPATITQGQSITLLGFAAGGNNGQAVTLNLSLNVTPQVTNDGAVLLKVNFSQDTLASNDLSTSLTKDTKAVQTSVLVDSGGTIVIGGVYSSNSVNSESGIPILRNLPIIGPFFGTKGKLEQKNELFIFLTPRVLNDKEAGIKS